MKISSWVTTRLLVPKPFSRIGCEPWRAPSALPAPPSERRSPAPGRRSPPPGPSAGWSYSACAASGTRWWHPADGPVETRLKKYQQQGGRERNNITEFPQSLLSYLFFGLQEVLVDALHLCLQPLVLLSQQLLVLLHQPGQLVSVPLLTLIQDAARVQGSL